MKTAVAFIFEFLRSLLKSQKNLVCENLLLRQQLEIYQRQSKKPKLENTDRFILAGLCRLFNSWKPVLLVVKPETVIKWHRKGFKYYWRRKSRHIGRPHIDWKLIKLIRRLQKDNPLWSAQRIQEELAKLGYSVCDNTVSKYMKKPRADPDQRQRWQTFLRNHAKHIIGIDFMVVRTIFFRTVYVFIMVSHDRRKILYFNISSNPHSQWTIQRLCGTVAYDETTKHVIRDNDAIFSWDFKLTVHRLGLKDTLTAFRSPWQNGTCERVIGTLRRECLDHMIILNEKYLHSVLSKFIEYYNSYRTHMSLDKDTPVHRTVQREGKIVSQSVLGGLHHVYSRVA